MNRLTLGIIIAVGMLGCGGSKVSVDNYGKLKAGMKYDEVIAVLGKPTDEMTSSVKVDGIDMGQHGSVAGVTAALHTWKDGNAVIVVTFQNDAVAAMSRSGL